MPSYFGPGLLPIGLAQSGRMQKPLLRCLMQFYWVLVSPQLVLALVPAAGALREVTEWSAAKYSLSSVSLKSCTM